jgi:hypothetical protein
MKYCPCCTETKDLILFSKSYGRYDGLQSHCKQCRSVQRKSDYLKNRDREIALSKVWVKSNPYLCNLKAKRHRESTSGRVYYNSRNAAQRASKLNATPPWLTSEHLEQIKSIYAHAQECGVLTGDTYHVDHIIPLKGVNVCGLHVPWNLQVLPSDINVAKGNSFG